MTNRITLIPMKLHLYEEFDKATMKFKEIVEYYKTSLDPFGYDFGLKGLCMIPYPMNKILLNFIGSKNTLVMSNMNASKKRLIYAGKKLLGLNYYV